MFALQEATLQGVLRRVLPALRVLGELTPEARHLGLLQANAHQVRVLNIVQVVDGSGANTYQASAWYFCRYQPCACRNSGLLMRPLSFANASNKNTLLGTR